MVLTRVADGYILELFRKNNEVHFFYQQEVIMSKLPRGYYRDGWHEPKRRAGFLYEIALSVSDGHIGLIRGKRRKKALMYKSGFDYSRVCEHDDISRSWKHRVRKRKQWEKHRRSDYERNLMNRSRCKQNISKLETEYPDRYAVDGE